MDRPLDFAGDEDLPVAILASGVAGPTLGAVDALLGRVADSSSSPVQPPSRFDDELATLAGLPRAEWRKLDRFSVLALAAARTTLAAARLSSEEVTRCGVLVGNMLAGWTFTEPQLDALHGRGPAAVSPYLATAWFPAAPQGLITIDLRMRGFAKTVSTDRCAGAQAIGFGFDRIRAGRSPLLLAGGVEAPLTSLARRALRALHVDGDTLAEGAAFLLLGNTVALGSCIIGAHSTFGWSPTVFRPDRELRRRIDAVLPAWSRAWPVASIFFNVPPGSEQMSMARDLAASAFRNADVYFPSTAFGELLAASGAVSAALACELLRRYSVPSSTLIVSLGHQCADVLWIYRSPIQS